MPRLIDPTNGLTADQVFDQISEAIDSLRRGEETRVNVVSQDGEGHYSVETERRPPRDQAGDE